MNNPKNTLPDGWNLRKLGEIGTFSKGAGITKDELVKSGIPCIRYGELYTIHNFVIREYKSFISRELANQSRRISKNDILMAGSGETLEDIGKAAAFVGDEEVYAGGDIIIFTPETYVNSICLSYLLNSGIVAKQKSKLGQGNSVVHIYSKDLSKLEIPLPPLAEQQKIAAILSTWDTALQTTTALLAQLQKRKKGLMQKLLAPKPDWQEVRLGEVGSTFNGITGKTGEDFGTGKPYITYLNIFKNTVINPKEVGFVNITESDNQNIVQYGDIFFTISSETPNEVGMSSVLLQNVEGYYLNSFCFGFRLNHFEALLPEFAGFLFRNREFRIEMYKLAQGSTRFNISKGEVLKLKINLPPLAEQTRTAAILNAADAEIGETKAYLAKLNQQKRGLMQQLLTGRVRVK